jgi:hypothetical protein
MGKPKVTPHHPRAGEADRAQAAKDVAEGLRQVIREGHETAQELREAAAEARAALAEVREAITTGFSGELAAGLARYQAGVESAVKRAEEHAMDRLDGLVAALLGDDLPEGETLVDAARRWMGRQAELEGRAG